MAKELTVESLEKLIQLKEEVRVAKWPDMECGSCGERLTDGDGTRNYTHVGPMMDRHGSNPVEVWEGERDVRGEYSHALSVYASSLLSIALERQIAVDLLQCDPKELIGAIEREIDGRRESAQKADRLLKQRDRAIESRNQSHSECLGLHQQVTRLQAILDGQEHWGF